MTLDKLKVAARQHEQREEWSAAIELYRQAIRAADGGAESGDPSLHNRIGDLEHKVGNDAAACEAWAMAAVRYGEQGFFNNAIALCGKILRLDPSRVETYLELARFQARKRVIYDVRQHLTAYRDRMASAGQGEEAFEALTRFGTEFASWRELAAVINELLGRDADGIGTEATSTGPADGREELIFLDTADEGRAKAAPSSAADDDDAIVIVPTAEAGPVDEELRIETTSIVELETPSDDVAATLGGLEPTSAEPLDRSDVGEIESASGVIDFERTADTVGDTPAVAGLDAIEFVPPETTGAIPLAGLETTEFEAPPAEEQPPAADGVADVLSVEVPDDADHAADTGSDDGIVFIDTEGQGDAAPPAGTERPDPLADRVTAHALMEHGDRAGSIAAMERALAGHLEHEDWSAAFRVAGELIEAEPQSIHRHQARVEVAAKWGDVPRLCEAYMALGDAFVRAGATDKAVAVYRRVLERDEHHAGAREALRRMAPSAATEATPDGFIDFGAMVNDDVGPRTTRMRTETTNVSADEDETFREALAEFKRALDQNLPVEDFQTHYDLGLAFREMGLLDEAIGEFQKALRAPEARLRTAEALGETFYEQGRPAVAEAVLRSVERGGTEGDAEKIGVLYWLGRALEAQGKRADALGCYERVLAVDVSFHDAATRVTDLAAGGGEA